MKKKKILIVDDERNIRLVIARSLETLGYLVDQVITAEEALEQVSKEKYNLILVDIKLPKMSGLELIDEFKRRKMKANVVIISAHGTIQTAVSCLKSGVLDFIEKPFSPDEIREIVRKYA